MLILPTDYSFWLLKMISKLIFSSKFVVYLVLNWIKKKNYHVGIFNSLKAFYKQANKILKKIK